MIDRQRLQHGVVDEREDGGRRADAKGERQRRRDGEAGIAAELPQCILHIFQ